MTRNLRPAHQVYEFYRDLRRTAGGQSDTRRAAVELLIEHEHWLHRGGFQEVAVHDDPERGEAFIRWDEAAAYLERGPRGSTTELAILRLAVALAQDTYAFTVLGQGHRQFVRQALNTALGGSNHVL